MSRSYVFAFAAVYAVVASFCVHAEDYVVSVAEGGSDVVWDDVSAAGPSGLLADGVKDRTLVKTGKGRLIIACDLKASGYAGEIVVREGYLRLRHDGACGTTAKGVVVVSGATLEGDPSYVSGGLKYENEPLTFEGFGVDGIEGAVKMLNKSPSTWNFFTKGKKTMTGDALWVGDSRLDVRGGELDMGGHTLYASNSFAIVQANVTNPGRIVYGSANNSLVLESYVKLNGGDTNALVMTSGSMEWKKFTEIQNWTLAISNNATIRPTIDALLSRTNLATALTYNHWAGPVHIADNATLNISLAWVNPATAYGPDPYHHLIQMHGKISGGGDIALAENGYLRIGCQTNDFTGGVKLGKRAILEASGVGSLGTGGLLSVGSGSWVEFLYGELYRGVMTDEEYKRIFGFKNSWHAGKPYYSAGSDVKFVGLADHAYGAVLDASEIATIYHDETNTLTLSQGVTGAPTVVNTDGTLVLGGAGDFNVGAIRVRDGELRIAGGARYHMGEDSFKIHGTYPMTPRLVVEDGAMLSARDDTSLGELPKGWIAGGLSGDGLRDHVRGIMEMHPGSVVSNILTVGGARQGEGNTITITNYTGALYMRGGTLVQHGSNSKDEFVVGDNADGYFEMSDGFFDASEKSVWILVGSKAGNYDTPGHGVVHMKGGRLEHRSVGFGVNDGGGFGHLRVSGGVVSNDTFIVGKSVWTGRNGGEGVVTVDGDAEIAVKGYAQLGAMSNSVSIVNLNGGVFNPYSLLVLTNLCQMSGASSQFCEFLEDANNPVYVNFSGGLYRPSMAYSWRGWLDSRVRRYTVFAGGAAVDTGAYDRQLHVHFSAPTGNGVKAIPFSCDEPWRYIGSPYVRIVDPEGTGYGASAFAEFDSRNGTISGVTITSPGCDYSEGTYAEISFGGWTNTLRVAAEVAPNDLSGGFTKYGAGMLELAATNDWHGVTCVKEGRLNLVVADALPNTSGYDIAAGAKVYFSEKHQCGGTLAGAGVLTGDYELSGTFTVDAADLIAGRYMTVNGNLAIAPGTRLVVKNAELLTEKFVSRPLIEVLKGSMTGTLDFDVNDLPVLSALRRGESAFYLGSVYGTTIVIR